MAVGGTTTRDFPHSRVKPHWQQAWESLGQWPMSLPWLEAGGAGRGGVQQQHQASCRCFLVWAQSLAVAPRFLEGDAILISELNLT